MPSRVRLRWSRRSDGGELLEWFLVAAIVSFLGIRWFLALTGYPQVGGGGLHIAHMLWGGLLMLVALVVLFLFLGRPVHQAAAVVAGLGFGTFVDEIGKFLTSDNDYFFKPAVALIYLIFVGLFLLLRAFDTRRRLTPQESLANALDIAEAAVDGRLDRRTRSEASRLLDRADPADPLVAALRSWLAMRTDRRAQLSWLDRIAGRAERVYEAAVSNRLFERAVIVVVVVDAIATMAASVVLVVAFGRGTGTEAGTISGAGEAISSVAGALLVLRGVPLLRRSRADAYRWFRWGVLVWILVTQVFVFYTSQLAGIGGLVLDLAVYAGLTYMLEEETVRSERHRGGTASA